MNVLGLIGGPLVFIGVVQLAFAVFCLSKIRRKNLLPLYLSSLALAGGAYGICIGLAYVRASMGLSYAVAYRLGWLGWFMAPLCILLTNRLRTEVPRYERIGSWLMLPVWALMNAINFFTDWVDIEPPTFIPYVDRGGSLELPFRFVGTLNVIWVLYALMRLRKESVGFKRLQTNYLLLGCNIFAAGAACTQLPWGDYVLDPGLASYLSFPWISLTMYAVLRHRLFDVRLVLSRIISAGVLLVVFSAFHILMARSLQGMLGSNIGLVVAAIASGFIAFGTPLAGFIRGLVDRIVMKKRLDYQSALKASSEALISILNLDDLMRKFIEIARKSLGIQLAGFYLLENDKFVLRYILGTKNEPEVRELSFSSRLVQWMSTHKKALVREEELHVLSESEMAELNRDFSHTEAEAAVPVFYKGVLTGFLVLGYKSNKDAFLEEDIHFLETLAPQVAVAIENSRLFSEATTDGLTGLYHQKYFKARLKSEFERAVRHGHNLILALVDIDHFKRVNDNYGHLMGDAVLKGVAKILHNSFRIEDLVARYGGEEFAILLNEPNPKAARLVAERIRKRVENFHFEHGIRVTVSIGLYVLENSSDCPNELELIQRADEALYKAKNSGRNRVIFFEEVSRIKAVNSAS